MRLIWPLILWTWIFFGLKIIAGDFTNTPVTWRDFPFFPLPPLGQFWFLWALFLVQIATLFVWYLTYGKNRSKIVWLLVFGCSLLFFFTHPYPESWAQWLVGAVSNMPYFVSGILLASLKSFKPSMQIAMVAFGVFIIAETTAVMAPQTQILSLACAVFAIISFSLLMIALEKVCDTNRALDLLKLLGSASMAIYVTHVIFSAAVRIALLSLGVTDLWLHLPLGTIAGIAGPLVMLIVCQRIGIARHIGLY